MEAHLHKIQGGYGRLVAEVDSIVAAMVGSADQDRGHQVSPEVMLVLDSPLLQILMAEAAEGPLDLTAQAPPELVRLQLQLEALPMEVR